MGQYFLSKVLEGLSFEIDFVKVWLPMLQNANNPKYKHSADVAKLGSVSLAVVGLAAVEQYAKSKKLRNGTVQDLRYRAFSHYQAALTRSIYENAQLRILEMLTEQKPELSDWVRNVTEEIRGALDKNWQHVAAATAQILYDIQGQQYRRGHKGRKEIFGGKGRKAAHHVRDMIDAELLRNAVNALPISQQNEIELIRKNLRPLVRDFIIRGILQSGTQSQSQAIDKHAKRLFRKLNILAKGSRKIQ